MADQHRNTLSCVVTAEQVDHFGNRGHFVKVVRRMDDGGTITDWYTRDTALDLAEQLIRAARS